MNEGDSSTERTPGAHDRGTAIMLLHGQPGAGSDWDPVVAALPRHLTTLAFDRPGYRSNARPPGTFGDNVDWLFDELDRAGFRHAILVGHSYGGGVALAAAERAPERIRGLVLVSSVGPGCLDGWDRLLAAPITGPVCAIAAWWLTPWAARRRLARIERRTNRPLQPHEYVNWEAWANARHEHGAMWRTFLTEERELVHGIGTINAGLGRISSPTVVIADETDTMIPVETAHALAEQIPNARLVLVSGAGHHLPRRMPNAVADEIADLAASLS